MNPLTYIAGILANGLQCVATWMAGYSGTATTEARRINDEIHKKDEFRKALADAHAAVLRGDEAAAKEATDRVRRALSATPQ